MPTATSPRQPRPHPPGRDDSGSTPDESWLKADIQAWLDREQIDYPSSATKAELLDLT